MRILIFLLCMGMLAAPGAFTLHGPGCGLAFAEEDGDLVGEDDAELVGDDGAGLVGDETGLVGEGAELFGEDELTISATRRATTTKEAPGLVTVITREELEHLGAITLADALRFIPSMRIIPRVTTSHGMIYRGVFSQFNQAILLLIDGRPVNDNLTGSFSADLKTPLENIERIEFIRGPGSALYGPNAFAGVISIITRKGSDIEGVEIGARGGSYSHVGGYVNAGQEVGDLEYAVSVRGNTSDGPETDPADLNPLNPSFSLDNLDHEDLTAQAQLNYLGLTTILSFQSYDAGRMGQVDFITPEDRDAYTIFSGDVSYQLEILENLTLMPRVMYTRHDGTRDLEQRNLNAVPINTLGDNVPVQNFTRQDLDNIINCVQQNGGDVSQCAQEFLAALANAEEVTDGSQEGEAYVTLDSVSSILSGDFPIKEVDDMQQRAIGSLGLAWDPRENISVNFGVEYRYDSIDNEELGGEQDTSLTSVYYQGRFRLSENTILTLGGRYDYDDIYEDFISPRASLVWFPNEKTAIRLSVGRAFRAPNFTEQYANFFLRSSRISGNENLDVETITHGEVSYEFTANRFFKIRANAFRYGIDDYIDFLGTFSDVYVYVNDFVPDDFLAFVPGGPTSHVPLTYRFENAGDRDVAGVELEFFSNPADWISLYVSYFYQDLAFETQIQDDSLQEFQRSQDGITAQVTFHYKKMAYLSIQGNSLGYSDFPARQNITENTPIENVRFWDSDFAHVNLSAGFRWEGLAVQANVYNLFDNQNLHYEEVYYDGPFEIPNSEISFLGQVSYTMKL